MAYETNYYQQQGSGDTGEPGTPGTGDPTTPQTPVEIDTTTIISKDFKIMTGRDSGDVVGSGNLTLFINGLKSIYKLSATLPLIDPPTVENNANVTRYYANVGKISMIGSAMRGTDDGLALFEISIINRTPDNFLQLFYYGGSGNGVMNTVFMNT